MLYWLPFLLFLGSGVVAAYAQDTYFSGLIGGGARLRPNEKVAEDIRRDPRSLVRVVATEVRLRLVALATHQRSAGLERQRRIALLSIMVSLGCFVWWAWIT